MKEYYTIGVVRPKNVFFCDVDSKDFDIYVTKGGFHIVARLHGNKFDYQFRRLRITPKLDSSGKIVNPAPKLLLCHCKGKHHIDKRGRRLEAYRTKTA